MPAANEEQIARIMSKTILRPHKMIWRDDDIGRDPDNHDGSPGNEETEFKKFVEADNIFKRYGFTHTIAVITSGLHEKKKLTDYINNHTHIDPQIHCYQHVDFTKITAEEVVANIRRSIKDYRELFSREPKTLYPPYNGTNQEVIRIAGDYGLKVSTEKLSLNQYCRVKGAVKENTVNFHYWNYGDFSRLDEALAIYDEMGWDR